MIGAGILLLTTLSVSTPLGEEAKASDCKLCLEAREREHDAPLRVEVDSGITFSRMALAGRNDGAASIDHETGNKWMAGGMLDLGGLSYSGHVRVSGEPLRTVRIELPSSVIMRSPQGAEAELSEFRTSLDALPMLDQNGELEFTFGARLATKDSRGGNFRGRIPIRVSYN